METSGTSSTTKTSAYPSYSGGSVGSRREESFEARPGSWTSSQRCSPRQVQKKTFESRRSASRRVTNGSGFESHRPPDFSPSTALGVKLRAGHRVKGELFGVRAGRWKFQGATAVQERPAEPGSGESISQSGRNTLRAPGYVESLSSSRCLSPQPGNESPIGPSSDRNWRTLHAGYARPNALKISPPYVLEEPES